MIVSRHIFEGTPSDARAILEDLRGRGAEIVKLAVMVERLSDLRTLVEAARPDGSTILIGMGSAGVATRVLASRLGSRWTYAGNAIAPGQIAASRLLREYHFRRIRPDSAIYALIGRPVVDSLSPAMHNAGFAALGLDAVYVPFETRDLADLGPLAVALGLRGASITIPFKRDLLGIVDEAAPTAAAAGAVNTVAVRNGRWIGLNTDAEGFLEPLRPQIALRGLRAVILGAGGAARGVGHALLREGAEVALSARRPDAALAAARGIGAAAAAWPPAAGSWDILVNATPVGSRALAGMPFTGPFDGRLVYDLVYDPAPTELAAAASAAGCTVIGGLAMLVAQAERQFQIWTGQPPPAGLFHAAATSELRHRGLNS